MCNSLGEKDIKQAEVEETKMKERVENLIMQEKTLVKTLAQLRASVKEAKEDNERKQEQVKYQVAQFKQQEYVL